MALSETSTDPHLLVALHAWPAHEGVALALGSGLPITRDESLVSYDVVTLSVRSFSVAPPPFQRMVGSHTL